MLRIRKISSMRRRLAHLLGACLAYSFLLPSALAQTAAPKFEYGDASGVAEASMSMPRSYPFSSSIRVLCENAVAEYGFSAAPVEGEGNIGASSSARGLRVFPIKGEPETVPVESADPWGPEIEEFVSCVEQGRQPAQGTGEQASIALRVSLAAARSLESGRPEAV